MKFQKKTKKLVSIIVMAVMVLSFAACSEKEETKTVGKDAQALKSMDYPLKTDQTLTWWEVLNATVAANYSNKGETPYAGYLEEATGVKVEYVHPSAGGAMEQLTLLIASGDLPDIMFWQWGNYPGGPGSAISEGNILDVSSLAKEYSPTYYNLLKESELSRKSATDDTGALWGYVSTFTDETFLPAVTGLMLREDWLKELNLSVPETIEEWETVLKAFRDKKGAKAPFSFNSSEKAPLNLFSGAFGVGYEFYVDKDGKVKYGPMEKGFRDFVELMRKWYKDGLLDYRHPAVGQTMLNQSMVSGETGAAFGYVGSGMGGWLTTMKDDPTYALVAAKSPVLKKGDTPGFGSYNVPGAYGAVISGDCKNPELAAKYLDFWYTDEGSLLTIFGKEGVSYNMVDGYPKFTEEITNNPDNIPFATALASYSNGAYGAPGKADYRYTEQYYANQCQIDALNIWKDNNSEKTTLPLVYPTEDEASTMSNIYTEIETFVSEKVWKFIIGTESMDNYDSFVKTIESMGIDEVLKIKQAGIDRYNKR